MFKRLIISLTKPPQLVLFMKDSYKRIILYLILLPLILVIPSAIRFAINPDMSVAQYNALSEVLEADFNLQGSTIDDGVFSTTLSQTAQFDYFQITTTTTALNAYSMTFYFDTDKVILYLGTTSYRDLSYVSLGIENYTFDFTDSNNVTLLANAIRTLYNTQQLTNYIQLMSVYFIGLVDFLIVVLMLAVIDYFIIPNQPFPFKLRFKLSVYGSTIYIFAELIFILTNISQLNFISIIIAYAYHIWIYRSIKIIPKGVNLNGDIK